MRAIETNDGETIALMALAWIMADDQRAERFLALTGLTPEAMRDRIDDPALLAAVLRFLEGHEPDLIACAEATGIAPAQLVHARATLAP